jgi:diguanylate cyclase (GGDEF)-like protein
MSPNEVSDIPASKLGDKGVQAYATQSETPPRIRYHTILTSGEDPTIEFVERSLRAEGHPVMRAANGSQVLRLAREHSPALVLLNAALPGVDAYAVCRRLRSDWLFASTAIILLAPRSQGARVAEGLFVGADDFILGPFDGGELLVRIKLTLQRMEDVRSASPLTGLPGNVRIERELRRRVGAHERLALLYIDLDRFKAFNDHYGFLRGDQAIGALAEVLRVAAERRPGSYLGHVGGDDFIMISAPETVGDIVREVASQFESTVRALYDEHDAARGWIDVEDRRGRTHRFGLLTLSIGVATTLGPQVEDHRRLVDLATEMKQYAKSLEGSSVAVDRRGGKEIAAILEQVGPYWRTRSKLSTLGLTLMHWRGRRWAGGLVRVAARAGSARRRPRVPSLLRRMALRLAAALLVLAVATGTVMVPLAEAASPGDLLWPVKLRVEALRLALERDPAGDVVLHLAFASRRVEELQTLVMDGDPSALVTRVAGNLREHTGAVVQGLPELQAAGRAVLELRARVEATLAQHVAVFRALVSKACGDGALLATPRSGACVSLAQALASSTRTLQIVSPQVSREGPPARRRQGERDPNTKRSGDKRRPRGAVGEAPDESRGGVGPVDVPPGQALVEDVLDQGLPPHGPPEELPGAQDQKGQDQGKHGKQGKHGNQGNQG